MNFMLLRDINAVIYGAGGSLGGAVARALAKAGADVFLTGRRRSSPPAAAPKPPKSTPSMRRRSMAT
jgi:NAD(P)-dependent dehydrogenase (short-subunit alcohol dehydrogenase family)